MELCNIGLTKRENLKITASFYKIHNAKKGNAKGREKLVVIEKGHTRLEFFSTSLAAAFLKMPNNEISHHFHRATCYKGWRVIQIANKKAYPGKIKKLKDSDVLEIKKLLVEGLDFYSISYMFQCSYEAIKLIKQEKHFVNVPWPE